MRSLIIVIIASLGVLIFIKCGDEICSPFRATLTVEADLPEYVSALWIKQTNDTLGTIPVRQRSKYKGKRNKTFNITLTAPSKVKGDDGQVTAGNGKNASEKIVKYEAMVYIDTTLEQLGFVDNLVPVVPLTYTDTSIYSKCQCDLGTEKLRWPK